MKTLTELKSRRDQLNRELMSLHLQISTVEQEAAPEHRCSLNGVEPIDKSPCYGITLRGRLSPDQRNHMLFFENTGNAPDIIIQDNDPIPNGARIYSVPAGVMGG